MPTVFAHPAVPLAIGLGLGRKVISTPLLVCGVIGSVLPDLDVIAFRMGIPYAAEFGHRGFSHSLLFACVVALLGASFFRWFQAGFFRSFFFLFAAISSHGLLDTLTHGGLGIALFWPWSEHRYFMPFHPIEVAPLSLSRFLSERGLSVLQSEFYWVWLPAIATAALLIFARLGLTKVPWTGSSSPQGRSRKRTASSISSGSQIAAPFSWRGFGQGRSRGRISTPLPLSPQRPTNKVRSREERAAI